MPLYIDPEKCEGCKVCDANCPGDVIYMKEYEDKKVAYLKYPDECWHCGSCRQDCEHDAITVEFSPEMLCM